MVKVESWNEWDPLRHVIVGSARGTVVQAEEPAVVRDFPAHGFPRGTCGPVPDELVERAEEQLDAFADLLSRRGIIVDRPVPIDFVQPVDTPEWHQDSMFGCMPPRDVLLTVGPQILEATMSARSRFFEYLCYRPLLHEYFREDPQMILEAAPKPRLTDASYRLGFWDQYETLGLEAKIGRVKENDLLLTDIEPLFDAADVCRLGKDMFVQLSLVTNRPGVRWLQQHFPEHRVHPVTFANDYPQHIDATWVPLRPGLMLHCAERAADDGLLAYMRANDWEVVASAPPSRSWEQLPPLCFCSPWLSMNVLVLDTQTVCVEASEVAQCEQLEHLGFDVIPVPFWDVAPFGGGLKCATADVWREGALEDYFPHRVGRF